MKLSKETLKRIIKEEMAKVMREIEGGEPMSAAAGKAIEFGNDVASDLMSGVNNLQFNGQDSEVADYGWTIDYESDDFIELSAGQFGIPGTSINDELTIKLSLEEMADGQIQSVEQMSGADLSLGSIEGNSDQMAAFINAINMAA